MATFAVGIAPGQVQTSRTVSPPWRRSSPHVGPIGPLVSATAPNVGSAPDVARWDARQMVTPASGVGQRDPHMVSAPEPLYTGGQFPAYGGRSMNAVEAQIGANPAQRVPQLWRTGMTGTAGVNAPGGGYTATMQSADGLGMLQGYAPILSPVTVPKLLAISGLNSGATFRARASGPALVGIPSVFVPLPRMGPAGGIGVSNR